jgi:hypothetical protein
MAHLDYKSLITKETIEYYLSKIKDEDNEKQKKDLVSTISKFDIRISTTGKNIILYLDNLMSIKTS